MLNKFWLLLVLIFLFTNGSFAQANTGEMLRKADDSYRDKNYQDASDIAMKVILINPKLMEAHKLWIKSSKQLNKIEKCTKFYQDKCNETILTFWNENRPYWLFGLGLSYLEISRTKEAQEAFNSCIKLNPTAPIVKDIQEVAKKNKLTIEIPERSLSDDIKLAGLAIGGIILLIILWGAYNAYKEKKIGERQAANIKKDRTVDFFGNIRRK